MTVTAYELVSQKLASGESGKVHALAGWDPVRTVCGRHTGGRLFTIEGESRDLGRVTCRRCALALFSEGHPLARVGRRRSGSTWNGGRTYQATAVCSCGWEKTTNVGTRRFAEVLHRDHVRDEFERAFPS